MHIITINACKDILKECLTPEEYKEFSELLAQGLRRLEPEPKPEPKEDPKKIEILEQRIENLRKNIRGLMLHLQRIMEKWEQPNQIAPAGLIKDLANFMETNQVSIPIVAKRLNYHDVTVRNWFNGKYKPSRTAYKKIKEFINEDEFKPTS